MPNEASTSDDLAPGNKRKTAEANLAHGGLCSLNDNRTESAPGAITEAKQRGRLNLKPPWKPGQSGNPSGRPKRKPLTEALEKIYSDPEECMAAARALAKKARKGSIAHFQEAANRLEGRVEAADESAGNVVYNVVISAPRPHRPAIGDRSGHDEQDGR
jgi:hypothetical protein